MRSLQHIHLITPFIKLLERITQTSPIQILDIIQQPQPEQGASGSQVRQYTVIYQTIDNNIKTTQLIIKQAKPLEQQIFQLFTEQKQAIPPAYIPTIDNTKSCPIYMQYARTRPLDDTLGDPNKPTAKQVANSLARIHATNLQQCPDWLPKASEDFMNELYLEETWMVWNRVMQNNDFYAEYGKYEKPLGQSLQKFLALMQDLTTEGNTLTIINSDLHPDHIRLLDDDIVLIDWEQACYGSFYLDLVNYFTIETALLYRDSLVEQGHVIPPADFIERFREVGRFMGLRYFEVGLLAWEAGGERWQAGRWFFHYCLTLALTGR